MFNGTRNEDWCVEVTRPIYVCKLKTERVWRAVFDARKGCKRVSCFFLVFFGGGGERRAARRSLVGGARAAPRLVSGCGGEGGHARRTRGGERQPEGAKLVRSELIIIIII